MADKTKVLKGRGAVDAYRQAHTKLHSKGWHKGMSEEHTPLLDKVLVKFKEQGFNSLEDFFTASEELNIQELGFTSREDFDAELYRGANRSMVVNEDGNEVEMVELTSEAQELLNKLRGVWH